MLKRRLNRNKDALELPTTQRSAIDGSGTSVRMEAPILRAAKNASPYTRNSWIWLCTSLFVIVWSWKHIWYHYATTFLECNGDDCVLKIIPPARRKKLTLTISRDQIVNAITLRVDENGEKDMGVFESYGIELSQYGKGAHVDAFELQRETLQHKVEESMSREEIDLVEKYGSAAYTDPDLREKMMKQKATKERNSKNSDISTGISASTDADTDTEKQREEKPKKERASKNYDLPNLEALKDYAIEEGNGQYLLILRKYNIHHRKRRVNALVNKINLYAKGSKSRLTIRENRNVVWQAILGIIFGVFSLLFSALLGQFSDPERTKTRGPGSRSNKGNLNSPYAYNTNRVASIPNRRPRSIAQQPSRPKAYGGYNANSKSTPSY